MNFYSGPISFQIDPFLSQEAKRTIGLLTEDLKNTKIDDFGSIILPHQCVIEFVSENSLKTIGPIRSFRVCLKEQNQGLFDFGTDIDESKVNVIFSESFEKKEFDFFTRSYFKSFSENKKNELIELGQKNLKILEQKARNSFLELVNKQSGELASELLDYVQSLFHFEKELIHAENLARIEKDLKSFIKMHLSGQKFSLVSESLLWKVDIKSNFFILPQYKGQFIGLEFSNIEKGGFGLFKTLFLIKTLVHFFNSKVDIEDPFSDTKLWEDALDNIPFPLALLSVDGVVCQHNNLFSKLSVSPIDCLNFKLKEKVLIGNIPYNVYRKEVFHLDETKILFVFFTESIFLKGEASLTPSGQELGIISSSIAHELNNPIAGIHAALSYLLLDENLSEEEKTNLKEMSLGAMRCKQLIETFLGFSRASIKGKNTLGDTISPIEFCYQQAQNLLRFRTVESGIRFSFKYIKHGSFKDEINVSLLTMTYYLILGEMMTLYSHQMLVANKNQIEKVIKGEIIESSQEIQIQLADLNISNLALSKLVQNLLNIENFVLQVSDYSLRFISHPTKDA